METSRDLHPTHHNIWRGKLEPKQKRTKITKSNTRKYHTTCTNGTATPTDTLYIETGLLDIYTITTKNRLNMGKRIQKNPERLDLVAKIMNNQTKGGWKDITNKIKTSILLHKLP